MRAYSMGLRVRVREAAEAGDTTAELAERFAARPAWVRRLRQTGESEGRYPRPPGRGLGDVADSATRPRIRTATDSLSSFALAGWVSYAASRASAPARAARGQPAAVIRLRLPARAARGPEPHRPGPRRGGVTSRPPP